MRPSKPGYALKDAFTLRRSQMLLASSRGTEVPQDRRESGMPASQTVRDAIHDFNRRGMDALVAGSSRPKRTRAAFDEKSAKPCASCSTALRGSLGETLASGPLRWQRRSLSRRGLPKGGSPEKRSGPLLCAFLGVRWQRAKRWITSPDPLYERKKDVAITDGNGGG